MSGVVTAALGAGLAQATPSMRYIGEAQLPTGTVFANSEIGGLSGIDWAGGNRYVAFSDDWGNNPTGRPSGFNISPRYYDLDVVISANAAPVVTVVGVTNLRKADGTLYGTRELDPEGFRLLGANQIVWTSEGYRNTAPFVDPGVFISDRATGVLQTALPIDSRYLTTGAPATGTRHNLGWEAIDVTADGKLWLGGEGPLIQDGLPPSPTSGAVSRLTLMTTAGVVEAEYVYPINPVAAVPNPANGFTVNGLVELLIIDETRFLALERSFSQGVAHTGQIYLVDTAGATNVAGLESLTSQVYTAVSKTLLFDLATLGIAIDNIEGMSWGPDFADGTKSLLIVSDNNFSGPASAFNPVPQFTQFLTFQVNVPEPASLALFAAGLAGLGVMARRRRTQGAPQAG